ncbi:cell division topological specificity factor MinE [Pseudanabaena sp. FACHB-1998]|uniref:cell division topological specificity factor MinE n=1 Tax=Pseudanabaena sp. FACHB-1998 TaxID=2692858 RepID=UPI00167FF8B0|nr:cell division topological specificity factor MinE [Pseudanabaena sp. FACHB-1998]MBD2178174.1 cell division topological specificity factor MinE [Pseudanabaena sp. FACHB-1998]
MISTLLDRLFQRSNVTSGTQVKQRLKFILAHDRAAIEPQIFDNMRHEIMRVVSKYVELDEASLDIRLESDKRMTALIANLPIRMVREELPDLVSLFDEPSEEVKPPINPDAIALEMDQSAEDALDAIAAKEIYKPIPDSSTLEEMAVVAERTTQVTSKLRTAANKSPSVELEKLAEPETFLVDTPKNKAQVIVERLEAISMGQNIANGELSIELPESEQSDQLELSLNLPEVVELLEESPESSPQKASEIINQQSSE